MQISCTEYVSDWRYRSGATIKSISTHGSGTQTQTQTHEPGWRRKWSRRTREETEQALVRLYNEAYLQRMGRPQELGV